MWAKPGLFVQGAGWPELGVEFRIRSAKLIIRLGNDSFRRKYLPAEDAPTHARPVLDIQFIALSRIERSIQPIGPKDAVLIQTLPPQIFNPVPVGCESASLHDGTRSGKNGKRGRISELRLGRVSRDVIGAKICDVAHKEAVTDHCRTARQQIHGGAGNLRTIPQEKTILYSDRLLPRLGSWSLVLD